MARVESDLRRYLLKRLPGHVVPVESGKVAPGTPDVNWCHGGVEVWVELKRLPQWPVRASTPVRLRHFTAKQRDWLLARHNAGGHAYLLAQIGTDVLLYTAPMAYLIQVQARDSVWMLENAAARWTERRAVPDGMVKYVRENNLL